MSDHSDPEGDGTPNRPMIVPSDESVSDGHNSPEQRNDDGEASQHTGAHQIEQGTQVTSSNNQGAAATRNQVAASTTPQHPSAVPTLPDSTNGTTTATAANNPPSSVGGNAVGTAAASAAASAAPSQSNGPTTGVTSNATGSGVWPGHIPIPASAVRLIGTVPPGTNQGLRHPNEYFFPDPNDPTKFIARFRIENPNRPNTYYRQQDLIPMRDERAISPEEPSFYFVPDLTESKIEKRIRASKKNDHQPNLWVRQGNSRKWTRKDPKGGPDQVFQPRVVFRRFNTVTHKYEEIYHNLRLLNNIDPNNKAWMYAYNKWIDQIRRRRDSTYVKTVRKDHWSVDERRAMCEAINAYVRQAGLHRFGSGSAVQIPQADMQVIADAVNRVGRHNRQPDAVRSQIFTSHLRKNKAVFDLLERAKDLRDRMARGEQPTRAQRYPSEAIARKNFPKDTTSKKGRAGQHSSATEDTDSDSGLSDVSAKQRSDVPLPAQISDFLNAEETKGIRPSRKVKFTTDSGNELASDDQWPSTDGEELSEDDDNDEQIERSAKAQEAERKHAIDLQTAIHRSHQRAPRAVGVAVPGEEDSSDSDSDEDDIPARPPPSAAPSSGKGKGKQRAQAADGPATPSPQQKKRKRTPEAEDDDSASDGDDEGETSTPQGRSVKKMRTKPRK